MVLAKYLVNVGIAILLGSGIPATSGLSGWELYTATGITAAAVALFNLWQHKPGAEPQGK